MALSVAAAALVVCGGGALGLYTWRSAWLGLREIPWGAVALFGAAAALVLVAVRRPSESGAIRNTGDGRIRWPNAVTPVVAVAAVAALAFTGQQARQSADAIRDQLRIAEEGQATERFSRAVSQLGDGSPDVRIGGIYGLERMMRDSPADQQSIVEILCAFIRSHRPLRRPGEQEPPLPPDVQAGLTVIARRDARNDDRRPDLSKTELAGADLGRASLDGAILEGANLAGAQLGSATLRGANLLGVDLQGVDAQGAHLQGANLTNAKLGGANLIFVELPDADLANVDLTDADLTDANLAGAYLGGATLLDANLQDADLTGASLRDANLPGANLTHAKLDCANLRTAADTTNVIAPPC